MKDIEILETQLKLAKKEKQHLNYFDVKAIENLLKENKELGDQAKILDEAYTQVIRESKKWFDIAHKSIPKSLVKEKIEELDKLIKETQKELGSASKEFTIYVYQKGILQELLGE